MGYRTPSQALSRGWDFSIFHLRWTNTFTYQSCTFIFECICQNIISFTEMIANITTPHLHNCSLTQCFVSQFKILRAQYYVLGPDTGWDDSRCFTFSTFAWIRLGTAPSIRFQIYYSVTFICFDASYAVPIRLSAYKKLNNLHGSEHSPRNSAYCTEPVYSLTCSDNPASFPCSESDYSNLGPLISFV